MTVLSPIASVPTVGASSRPAGSSATVGAGFDAALADTAAVAETAASFRHQSSRSSELKPEQAFESFVLRSFIEEMLPKENTAVFGGGTAGNIWRSMLAERIADEMAASGGIGIADTIARDAKTPAAD